MWRGLGDFESVDLDGDGEITKNEVRVALTRKLGEEPSDIMLENVLRSFDADGSGTISREEFELGVGDGVPSVRAAG